MGRGGAAREDARPTVLVCPATLVGEQSDVSESMTEMTGTNCTLDAARKGSEKHRQLLRKENWLTEILFPS